MAGGVWVEDEKKWYSQSAADVKNIIEAYYKVRFATLETFLRFKGEIENELLSKENKHHKLSRFSLLNKGKRHESTSKLYGEILDDLTKFHSELLKTESNTAKPLFANDNDYLSDHYFTQKIPNVRS